MLRYQEERAPGETWGIFCPAVGQNRQNNG